MKTKKETKKCIRCEETKSVTEFYARGVNKPGQYFSVCKNCNHDDYMANREARIAYNSRNQKIYQSNRLKNDPSFAIMKNVRKCTNYAIIVGSSKPSKGAEYLGCTGAEAKKHIESLWTKGMTWDNYGGGPGKWNIDHIKPISSFDLLDEKQLKKCFNYKNLQPLWHEDNIKKGTK